MLKFIEFKEELVNEISNAIGIVGVSDISVSTEYVETPYGMEDRLNIKTIYSPIAMSVKLNGLYDFYKERALNGDEDIVVEIARHIFIDYLKHRDEEREQEEEYNKYLDYSNAKSNIALSALPLDANPNIYPHFMVGSMRIGVRICIEENEEGMTSMLVSYDLLEHFGIEKSELFKDARKNSQKYREIVFRKLGDCCGETEDEDEEEGNALVVTLEHNGGGLGASVIAYENFIDECRERIEGSFYIIPSSSRDVIVFKKIDEGEADMTLNACLRLTNSQLPRSETVSENVMYYDEEQDEILVIE